MNQKYFVHGYVIPDTLEGKKKPLVAEDIKSFEIIPHVNKNCTLIENGIKYSFKTEDLIKLGKYLELFSKLEEKPIPIPTSNL